MRDALLPVQDDREGGGQVRDALLLHEAVRGWEDAAVGTSSLRCTSRMEDLDIHSLLS